MCKTIVNCETCRKELERKPYQIKASKTGLFFCNRECRSKWDSIKFKNKKVSKKCKLCEKEFKGVESEIKNRIFCSKKCMDENKRINGRIKLKCDNCDKDITKKKSMIRDNNFCNKKCCNDWNSKKSKQVNYECLICKKEFKRLKSYKNKAVTCSIKCLNKHKSYLAKTDEKVRLQLRRNGLKTVSLGIKKFDTKPELIVKQQLKVNGIKYESQKKMYNKYIVDFYLPEKNTIIEVNGDYWHCNPEVYGYAEGLKKPNKYQLEKIKKDNARKNFLESEGFKYIILWEKDIHNNLSSIMEQIIN